MEQPPQIVESEPHKPTPPSEYIKYFRHLSVTRQERLPPECVSRLLTIIDDLCDALKPFADYVQPLDENNDRNELHIGYYPNSPTVFDVRCAAKTYNSVRPAE